MDWNLPLNSFDFVHSRYNHLRIISWPDHLQKAYNVLKPGGYIEVHDKLFKIFCDDGTFREGSGLWRWHTDIIRGIQMDQSNRQPDMVGADIVKHLEDCGFQDIRIKSWKVPVNAWAKDEQMKELGRLHQAALLYKLEALTAPVFTSHFKLSEEDAFKICQEAVKDLKNRSVHAYQYIHAIYGRKPDHS
jgi:hypothetical protein